MNKVMKILALTAAIAALAAGAVFFLRGGGPQERLCELCERPVHHETAFSLSIGGRKIWACCARCGLSIHAGRERDARDAIATDYPTGKPIPAERCVYVEGSDLAPCCSPAVIITGTKTACGKCFDRCYPSAIAFADPKEALAFSREHGGRMVAFETLLRELSKP